jgi:NTE family protein
MKNIALVISSGGARGLAAIGIIEELEKRGHKITSVAGCSIGSLITGMHASGNLSVFKEWVLKLDKKEIFRLMDFTISTQGVLKGDKAFKEIQKIIQDVKIEDLPIPYTAVAVDLVTHKEFVFNSGSLFNAIKGSSSIPSVVTPMKLNDKILVDGGIINPLPLSNIKRTDGDILIGIDLNTFNQASYSDSTHFLDYSKYIRMVSDYIPINLNQDSKVGSFLDISSRTFQIMQDEIIKYSIKENNPDLMISIPRNTSHMFDFFKAEELIEFGRKTFLEEIENNKEMNILI